MPHTRLHKHHSESHTRHITQIKRSLILVTSHKEMYALSVIQVGLLSGAPTHYKEHLADVTESVHILTSVCFTATCAQQQNIHIRNYLNHEIA